MHRSGSSLFSGCLDVVGIDHGKNKTTEINEYNQKGYFENESILDFNEKILAIIGSSWFDKNPITQSQIDILLKYKEHLKTILKIEFQNQNQILQ